ncbi:hypothetical protein Ddye_004689 [Dipteronia dyeriana]|uniref:DUF4283 domain-containing protein n=1 Tax=Dipteronia dyeriana TaxID=168575 RepID=A0AAD9XER8_9ROSI|nr:hypothetical protein Ddye_004689 [Dipteronia dyeriana]
MEVSDLFPELELRTRDPSIQKDFHTNGLSNLKPVMKSNAQAISSAIAPVSSAPKKKGICVAIKVNPKAYEERLILCSYSLIGRVILSKGEEPWKVLALKEKLQSFWKLNYQWHLISLGRGFFQILLNSKEDKAKVWGIRPLHLKPGTLRLQPWTQNFDPNTQRTTNAQIWVRFYDLPWEFWHPQILSDMARGIEIPLKFDRATLEGDYGHFACMLIDVDLSKPLPDSIMIEVGDDCLFPTLFFENVPSFCSVCCSIGHSAASCHHATRFTGNITTEPNDKIPERGRSKIRQEYRPKHKSRDVPNSRVFETIESDTEHVDIDPTSYPVMTDIEASIDPLRVEPYLYNHEGEANSYTDSEGTESDFSDPTTLDITCVQGGESWVDQSEDSGWKEVTTKKGDFNSVLGAHETTGNIYTISCYDFRAALTVCDLVDIETKGVFHTRIGRGRQDHHPLLVSGSASVSLGPRPFMFHGMWVSHPSFLNLVRLVWSSSFIGSGTGIVVQKLKLLKKALRKWNLEVFRNITLNVTKANEKVMLIQGRIGSEGFSDDLFRLETVALADLDSALKQQEFFLKEKSRVRWLAEGDRNSNFFHSL